MNGVLLFLLMIVAAVVLGLAIVYWYLSRVADSGGAVRRPPKAVPFPQKHPPVDLTPTSSDWLQHRPAQAPANDALPQQLQPLRSSPNREKDDLKQIAGIGPKLERLLHANGVFNFGQIAGWQDDDIRAIDELLPAFRGRVRRDDWVGQAQRLDAQRRGRRAPNKRSCRIDSGQSLRATTRLSSIATGSIRGTATETGR